MEKENQISGGQSESLIAKIKTDKDLEERLNMLTKKSDDVPYIHTMESDIYDNVRKDNIDKIKILSGQMDKPALPIFAETSKNKTLYYIIAAFILLLIICVSVYFYIFVYNKKQEPVIVAPIIPEYTVSSIWNDSFSQNLFDKNTEATSTATSIVVKISNFDAIYPVILQNESRFRPLALAKYKYNTLSTFSDVTIQNINMRVSDGGEGSLVYGYVGKDYLIISGSVNDYLEMYKKYTIN